jgi:hypothetical protein
MELDLLPFTHRQGLTPERSPTYDKISRGVLWTVCQNATTKYTFEVFIAALGLPGATAERGWNGVVVSVNRLNEAHCRATQAPRKYENTKAGLDELVRMRVARVKYDKRNRLTSLRILVDAMMFPLQESMDPPKKEYSQNRGSPVEGVKPPPKKGGNLPQNGGTIDKRIKGEVAPRQPSPIPSQAGQPGRRAERAEGPSAPPVHEKTEKHDELDRWAYGVLNEDEAMDELEKAAVRSYIRLGASEEEMQAAFYEHTRIANTTNATVPAPIIYGPPTLEQHMLTEAAKRKAEHLLAQAAAMEEGDQ